MGDTTLTSMDNPANTAVMSFTASGHFTGKRVNTVNCWTQFTTSFNRLPPWARLHPKRRSNSTKTIIATDTPAERPAVHSSDFCLSGHMVQVDADPRRYHPSSQTAQSIPVWPALQYLRVVSVYEVRRGGRLVCK